MSSINSSDRARHTEEIRNQREEYQNRETEQTKRHKKEVKRMAERQDQELEELKQGYEAKIQTLKDKANEALTERDQENQAKITKLRQLYSESLKKRSEDSESLNGAQRDALRNQLTKERQVAQQQRNLLKQGFEDTIQEKNREFEDFSNRSRFEMKQAIDRNQDRLGKKHSVEMKAVTEDRDERLSAASQNLAASKSVYENRIKDQERKHRFDMQKTESNWQTTYMEKDREMNDLLEGKREELKLAQRKIQGEANSRVNEKIAQMDQVRENYRDQIENRVDRDLRSAESENRRLKNDHLVEMMTTKRLRDLEKKNVIMDYEDKMAQLATSKDGLVEEGKRINHQRISDAARKNNEILRQSTIRTKSNEMLAQERHKEAQAQTQVDYENKIKHLTNSTGERVDKLMKATSESQKNQLKMHTENLDALKLSYHEELSQQRQAQTQQLKETYMRMNERVKSTEDKLTKKLEDTVNNYEMKISQISEQYEKELKKQSEAFEGRLQNQKKAQNQDVKSQEMKSEMKLTRQQEEHEKEIDRLNRRHQEQMASLAQKMNYYRKS